MLIILLYYSISKQTALMCCLTGKGHMEIQTMLPNELDVACHNSTKSCTISGPASIVREFTEHLHGQNIFAKEVNVSNIPYHSRYITPVGAKLFTYLKQVNLKIAW